MPHPIAPKNPAFLAFLIIVFFYLFGIILTLAGIVSREPVAACVGGLLFFGGVYYTVLWVRAKYKDEHCDQQ
jgi:hypothetical protein